MKKTITVIVIVLLFLGLGYYLFSLSPQTNNNVSTSSSSYNGDISLTDIKTVSAPREIDSTDHLLGSSTATNTFIVYEDFECPACAVSAPVVQQVPTAFKDTKVVFRHFPLVQIHPNSVGAAYAAEAAGAQGKFWEMYNQLYAHQNGWASLSDPINDFATYAQAAGVSNIDQFKSDITSHKFKDVVQKDFSEAMGMNLTGTPTYIFNGHQISGSDIASLEKAAQSYYK